MLETTEPSAAPVSVPATPRNEAATAAVTAARAPPAICVRLRPSGRRCGIGTVTASSASARRAVASVRGSGMTPGGVVGGRLYLRLYLRALLRPAAHGVWDVPVPARCGRAHPSL